MRDTESKWGYIDPTGEYVIRPQFQMPIIVTGRIDVHFSEGFAAGGGTDENVVISMQPVSTRSIRYFDGCSAFSDGLAVVQQNFRYGCINKRGELRVPFHSYLLFGFREGRAPILVDGRYGFIDQDGVAIIPPVWSGESIHPSVYGFHEGLAAVESEAGVGFLGVAGAIAIAPRLTGGSGFNQQPDGFLFSEGLAAFSLEGS